MLKVIQCVLNSNSVDLSKCGWQMVFTVIWPILLHWHELDGHVVTDMLA